MRKKLVKEVTTAVSEMTWPKLQKRTEQGRRIFLQSLDEVAARQRDPHALLDVLRLLQTADSRPYAQAGVANVLVAASKQAKGYFQPGLKQAMQWLEQAQADEADIVEINVIEALIYVHSNRLDDARLVLDYLQGVEPSNHYLHLAEIVYWTAVNNTQQAIVWIEEASISAITIPQRLRLRARLGDVYLRAQAYKEAVPVLREAVHFSKQDASLWHRLSFAYFRLGNLEEAELCNRRALTLQPTLKAAQKLQAAIKKQRGSTGLLRGLFGS